MKTKSLLLLTLISMVLILAGTSTVYAFVVSPESLNVQVFSSSSENFFINVTNSFNTSIYFVTLKTSSKDINIIDNKFNLTPGETKEIKLNLDTSDSYNKAEDIIVYYFEKRDVEQTPTTETVSITNLQYLPKEMTIVQGSTITFANNDTIKHSVTSVLFDQDLNPGQSYSYVFLDSGVFQYHDKYTNYVGQVIVQETLTSAFVHNPTTDKKVTVNIKSILVETEIELLFLEGLNYTVESGKSLESVFIIKNTGNTSIALARFQSNPAWITFAKSNLIIEPQKQSYVPFEIFPIIALANETGRSYTVEIVVKADNILDKFYNITVFIPFSASVNATSIFKQLNETISADFALTLYNTICKAYPDYEACQPKIVEKIIYKLPTLSFNITQEEFVELRRRILENTAHQEKGYAQIQEQVVSIKSNAEEANSRSAETLVLTQKLSQETTQTQSELKKLFIFFIVIAIVAGLAVLGSGIYLIIKKIFMSTSEFKT